MSSGREGHTLEKRDLGRTVAPATCRASGSLVDLRGAPFHGAYVLDVRNTRVLNSTSSEKQEG